MPQYQSLSSSEMDRYSRHLSVEKIGLKGQIKLKNSKVLIVGMGGLGVPVGQYLAACGVGELTLLDPDHVSLHNLQRQVLYSTSDIGQPKVFCAQKQLKQLNPEVQIIAHKLTLNPDNVVQYMDHKDLVIDCTDNFATRHMINYASQLLGVPWIYSAIFQFEGQVGLFGVKESTESKSKGCYHCLYPPTLQSSASLPNCLEAGVLGVLPGVVGSLVANQALKFLLDLKGNHLQQRILFLDALSLEFNILKIPPSPECPTCSLPKQDKPTLLESKIQSLKFQNHDFCLSPQSTDLSITLEQWIGLTATFSANALQFLDLRPKQAPPPIKLSSQGAQNFWIEPQQLLAEISKLDKSKHTLVYCTHGIKSDWAAKMLRSNGFESVYSLKGGTQIL